MFPLAFTVVPILLQPVAVRRRLTLMKLILGEILNFYVKIILQPRLVMVLFRFQIIQILQQVKCLYIMAFLMMKPRLPQFIELQTELAQARQPPLLVN